MRSLTFHYQTNALPVSKQWLLPPQNPPSLSSYCWAWHYRECNRPLVNLGQLCPLPTSCSPSAYLLGRQSWEKRQPGQHASTAQQQLKLGCVFTVLEQPNHSIICGCAYVAVHSSYGCYEQNYFHPRQIRYSISVGNGKFLLYAYDLSLMLLDHVMLYRILPL